MKTIVTLDQTDIEKVIAKHFGVNLGQVTVKTTTETSGYGLNESEIVKAVAFVNIDCTIGDPVGIGGFVS